MQFSLALLGCLLVLRVTDAVHDWSLASIIKLSERKGGGPSSVNEGDDDFIMAPQYSTGISSGIATPPSSWNAFEVASGTSNPLPYHPQFHPGTSGETRIHPQNLRKVSSHQSFEHQTIPNNKNYFDMSMLSAQFFQTPAGMLHAHFTVPEYVRSSTIPPPNSILDYDKISFIEKKKQAYQIPRHPGTLLKPQVPGNSLQRPTTEIFQKVISRPPAPKRKAEVLSTSAIDLFQGFNPEDGGNSLQSVTTSRLGSTNILDSSTPSPRPTFITEIEAGLAHQTSTSPDILPHSQVLSDLRNENDISMSISESARLSSSKKNPSSSPTRAQSRMKLMNTHTEVVARPKFTVTVQRILELQKLIDQEKYKDEYHAKRLKGELDELKAMVERIQFDRDAFEAQGLTQLERAKVDSILNNLDRDGEVRMPEVQYRRFTGIIARKRRKYSDQAEDYRTTSNQDDYFITKRPSRELLMLKERRGLLLNRTKEFLRHRDIWFSHWKRLTDIDFDAETSSDLAHIDFFKKYDVLPLYLFYVEAISAIIPRPKGEPKLEKKSELELATQSFRILINSLHSKDSLNIIRNNPELSQVHEEFLAQMTITGSGWQRGILWSLLNFWMLIHRKDLLRYTPTVGHLNQVENRLNRTMKEFFNNVFGYSIQNLTERYKTLDSLFEQARQ